MPEVQTSNNSGEMTQRFIELVMMQEQQAAMFLGRIPNPQTGQPEVNLEFARMFIDQLEMLQEKTRGNLSNEETQMLTGVLSDLRLAFVQASQSAPATAKPQETSSEAKVETPVASEPSTSSEPESRKKFTKSYGA
jgi:hypothetical protein